MKQKDIALIVIIVIMASGLSIVVSKSLFASKNGQQQAEVVAPISAEFPTPDQKYFNSTSFDPTKLITIGQSTVTDPFTSTPTDQ